MSIARREFLAAMGAVALASAARPVFAQDWPSRTIRLIVPYPPGGSSDIIARAISQPLSAALGQTVVVENRPGANGNLGAGQVAQSGEEGHTLLICDVGALAISPSVYTKLNFDPSKDLRGVGMLAYSPHVLAVHPSVQVKTLPELVELSKRQRLNFAVTAVGSAPHLAGVAVEQATAAKWEYVPYKGGSQAITDTVGGQTQIIMNGLLATLPHVQSGKLKAIAISKRSRMDILPDLPTIAEQGVTGFESGTWQGILVPRSMPDAVVQRLGAELTKIINQPDIKKKLNDQGAEVVTMSPAELDKFFAQERQRWAGVVAKADIRLD